jgi:hypothetical protein
MLYEPVSLVARTTAALSAREVSTEKKRRPVRPPKRETARRRFGRARRELVVVLVR